MDQNVVEYLKRLHEKFSQLKMRVATLEQQHVVHAGKEQKIQEKFQGLMDISKSHEVKIDDHKKSVTNHITAVEKRSLRQQIELEKERSKSASSAAFVVTHVVGAATVVPAPALELLQQLQQQHWLQHWLQRQLQQLQRQLECCRSCHQFLQICRSSR